MNWQLLYPAGVGKLLEVSFGKGTFVLASAMDLLETAAVNSLTQTQEAQS